jgi:hypothetical protein
MISTESWDRATRSARRPAAAGLLHQRAGDADALALAARQAVGARVAKSSPRPTASSSSKARATSSAGISQPGLARPARSRAGRSARSPSPSGARPGCIPGTPCRCGAAARRSSLPLAASPDPALEQDLAAGRVDQPVDAADQRGLAGAGRADDGGDAHRLSFLRSFTISTGLVGCGQRKGNRATSTDTLQAHPCDARHMPSLACDGRRRQSLSPLSTPTSSVDVASRRH